jgi:hypothetical protein
MTSRTAGINRLLFDSVRVCQPVAMSAFIVKGPKLSANLPAGHLVVVPSRVLPRDCVDVVFERKACYHYLQLLVGLIRIHHINVRR